MDWQQIKTEYITDSSMSYRKLAQKYKVGVQSITTRSKREGWIEQRERHKNDIVTKSLKKISERESSRISKYMEITDTLTQKLIEALELVQPGDTYALRQITSSLKDLKEMQGVKSEADRREQEARIRNLEKQAEADANTNTEVTIKFEAEGEKSEWAE